MAGRINVLMENSSSKGLAVEHGLSFLIDNGEHRILFDSGQSDLFLKNAADMGLSVDGVDTIILSHGHYDHANGIPNLFGILKDPDVYIGKDFFLPKYAKEPEGLRYNGPNFSHADLIDNGWRIHTVEMSPYQLFGEDSGLWLMTDFPRVDPLETIPKRFVREDAEGNISPDTFTDEIMLVIETKKGLLLIAGCSHPGIVNMIESVRDTFSQPIYGVIGGTHLVNADSERISHVIAYLKELDVALLGIAHCTGDRALEHVGEQDLSAIDCGAGVVIDWE